MIEITEFLDIGERKKCIQISSYRCSCYLSIGDFEISGRTEILNENDVEKLYNIFGKILGKESNA